MLKLNYRLLFLFAIIFSQVIVSCSETEEEPEELPKIVGEWERSWFSNEYNATLNQTLTVEKLNFLSNINAEINGQTVDLMSIEGTYTVIDNTLEGQIIGFGKVNESFQMEYFSSGTEDYSTRVFENLNMYKHFIGWWYVDGNNLVMGLDMDGDFRVSGDEGRFDFQKVGV